MFFSENTPYVLLQTSRGYLLVMLVTEITVDRYYWWLLNICYSIHQIKEEPEKIEDIYLLFMSRGQRIG